MFPTREYNTVFKNAVNKTISACPANFKLKL